MVSLGDQASAWRGLGQFLTATEARQVAARLDDDEPVSVALQAIDLGRRAEADSLVTAAGLRGSDLVALLRGIEGAKSVTMAVETLWTMPGHLAAASPLTTSTEQLVRNARSSVVCSTFNFQNTSGLWNALREAAQRPGVSVRVYIDAGATFEPGHGPDAKDIAHWLRPATVLRTSLVVGKPVRNHAKFVSVDHRFVVVTSANYSWSAENRNIELGVRIDSVALADSIESQIKSVEPEVYVDCVSL